MHAWIIIAACLVSAFVVTPAHSGAPLERQFNRAAFPGLAASAGDGLANARLDYELDSKLGSPLRFDHCAQVTATRADDVAESQHALFRLLAINCLAASQYSATAAAVRSYFPRQLTRRLIAAFPAGAIVALNVDQASRPAPGTLAPRVGAAVVRVGADGAAAVATAHDETLYTVMARADFDADGIEDLLVRIEWRALDAMGSGVDLVLLTRTRAGGPIRLPWRAGTSLRR